jgi:hypothetical protein
MRGTLGRANLGLFAALTLIVSGCASMRPYDPGPGRRAAAGVVRDAYLPGEPINVTIANLSEVILFYPDRFCKTELQRKEQGGWLTVVKPSKTCPETLGFLDPSQTVVQQFQLPAGIEGGTYRFAMPMPLPDEATGPEPKLVTPTFRVEAASTTAVAAAAAPAPVTATSASSGNGNGPKDR